MKYNFSILLLIIPFLVHSQRWEVGFQTGISNYLGDLAPQLTLRESHNAGGMFIKKNANPFISHTYSIIQGSISGNDKNFNHLEERNLSFYSTITELSYLFEFNFFPFGVGLHPNKFTPYSFIGFGGYIFEPKSFYSGDRVKLAPLDTEGKQIETTKSAYALYQFCIPIGGGFKIKLSRTVNCAINAGFRYSFTDYLDDVSTTYYSVDILGNQYGHLSAALSDRSETSIGFNGKQRGRPDIKDWYFFSGISFSFQIRNKVCFEF